MKSYLYCACILVLLLNCSEKPTLTNVQFPIDKKLEASYFSLPNDSIGNPGAMLVFDTLLVLDDSNDDYLYKVIDLKSESIIGRVGSIGKGPGEFMQPTLFELVPGKHRVLGIYDRRSRIYSEMNIDSAIKNRNYVSKVRTGPFNTNYAWVSKVNNDLYVGTGYFPKRYLISNSSGGIIEYALEYPYKDTYANASIMDIAFAFQAILKVKPDGQKCVLATYSSPNVEIISVKDGKISKHVDLYYGPPRFVPKSNDGAITVDYNPDNTWGFIDVSVSNDHIYLLYSGRSRDKSGPMSFVSNTVLVYDWEGKPVARYALDRDVNSMAIDEASGRLYASSLDPAIIVFGLN